MSLTRQPVLGSLAGPFGTAAVKVKKYPAPAAAQHRGDCQRFQGKATDASGGCRADRSSARRSRLDELQDKFIFRLRRIGGVLIARIGWVAQEVCFQSVVVIRLPAITSQRDMLVVATPWTYGLGRIPGIAVPMKLSAPVSAKVTAIAGRGNCYG